MFDLPGSDHFSRAPQTAGRSVHEVTEPEGARAVVEPNELTAPGRTGSADKGERQVRGERLAVSTREPTTAAKFVVRLKVEGSGATGGGRTPR